MDLKRVYHKIMDLMLDSILFGEKLSDFIKLHGGEFKNVDNVKMRELWLCVCNMCR